MSVRVMSMVFDADIKDFEFEKRRVTAHVMKLVLLALSDHCNDDGDGAYPSITRIEKKTALSRTAVINSIKALRQYGLIIRAGFSKRGTANYSINLPMLKSIKYKNGETPLFASAPGTPPKKEVVRGAYQTSARGVPKPSYNHPNIPEKDFGERDIKYEDCNEDGSPQKSTKKNKSIADSRTKHPAIKGYFAATGRNPRKINYDRVILTLGEKPDIIKLHKVYEEWCARDFNPGNIAGILDWYVNGISKTPMKKNTGMDAVKAELARLEQEENVSR